MAASPITVDAANMPPEDKWDHPHDTMITSPDNSNNGAPHSVDEHHTSHQQPPEDNDSYMRTESVTVEGSDAHPNGRGEVPHRGEKQIKVLVWSFFSLLLRSLSSPCIPPCLPASQSRKPYVYTCKKMVWVPPCATVMLAIGLVRASC